MPDSNTYLYVTDASVFIDAFNVGLFPYFFALGEIVTTDLVLYECRKDEMCKAALDKRIEANKLQIISLSISEMQLVVAEKQKTRGLSIPDCSILHVASIKAGILLTSDGRLKQSAKRRGLKTHGLIFCLEQLLEMKHIEKPFACTCLTRWESSNDFAPRNLIVEYKKKWSS